MTCEANYRVDFTGKDCLLDWECPVDQSSYPEVHPDSGNEGLQPKSCDRQNDVDENMKKICLVPLPTTCHGLRNDTGSDISDANCLLDCLTVDASYSDENKACLANKETLPGAPDDVCSPCEQIGSEEDAEGDNPDLKIQAGTAKEKVRAKLDWAETEVEQALDIAFEALSEKKKVLLAKLMELRRQDTEETSRAKHKPKTPIRVLKSSPVSGDDEEYAGVFVRKMVTKTNKRKLELKMILQIDELVKKVDSIATTARTMRYMIPFLEETLTTKFESDLENPDLVDVIVFTANGQLVVLVTDFKNMCLKSLTDRTGVDNNSLLSFNNSPWGIARIDESNVVVSVPLSNKVCVVEVSTCLTLKVTARTKKQYYGIVSIGSSLLVGTAPYSTPRSVDMFDLTGTVLKTMVVDSLLQQPSFICKAPSGTFMVSDLSKGALLSLSRDLTRNEAFSFNGETNLSSSRGVTTNKLGDIFVVDYQQKTVKVFSKNGQFVKDFLTSEDGINYPYGVCFDEQGLFYVTDGGTVKIFSY